MSKKKGKGGKAVGQDEAKGSKKAKVPKEAGPKISQAEIDALCKPVEEAKGVLEKARVEAKDLAGKAHTVVAEAKEAYGAVLAPYREACRKAGIECEYEGGRGANVSDRVSFVVEKTEKGVRVMIKGQPETEEVIPLAALKESVGKSAYGYTDKHLGPKEKIGNKGGGLSNRLRAVLAGA